MRATQKRHRQKGRVTEASGKDQIGFGEGSGSALDEALLRRHHFASEGVVMALNSRTTDLSHRVGTRVATRKFHRFAGNLFP